VDIVSNNNFLTTTLHNLFENVKDSTAPSTLKDRVAKFSEHLTNKFNWDFSLAAAEDEPVVVDEDGNY